MVKIHTRCLSCKKIFLHDGHFAVYLVTMKKYEGLLAPKKLRAYLETHDVKQRQVAQLIGVSANTLTCYLSSLRRPPVKLQYIIKTLTGTVELSDWLTTKEKNYIAKARAHILHLRKQPRVEKMDIRDEVAGRI